MSLTTIVAGADLSAPSEQAVERAAALAALHRAKLLIVHAVAEAAPLAHLNNDVLQQLSEVSAAVQAQVGARFRERLAALRSRGLDVELVSPIGPPGEQVAQVAKDRQADLIVVGTHGSTGISRFLLGSVATAILRHAPCDVLVCRGSVSAAPFSRPIAASDFSPASFRTVRAAANLCAPGVPIEVVHAWQLPAGSVGASLFGQSRFPWNTIRDAVLTGVQAQADKFVVGQAGLPNPIHVELIQGPPASAITHAAERGGHDLIAVGTHGARGFRRLLLGSVAESTVRHAPCSVLVVHSEHSEDPAKSRK